MAGVSSHGSDGPQLVPPGTAGVLGAGLLAAAFSGGGPISSAAERLKTELIPASTLVHVSIFIADNKCMQSNSVNVGVKYIIIQQCTLVLMRCVINGQQV